MKCATSLVLACCVLLNGCTTSEVRVFDRSPVLGQSQDQELAAVPLDELENLAQSSYEAGDYERGERLYNAVLARKPADAEGWSRLGNIYARTGRPDEAVRAYREALLRDPALAKAWHNMGVIQLQQAANSFQQMQFHADPNQPLVRSGKQTRDGILSLLQGDEPASPELLPMLEMLSVPEAGSNAEPGSGAAAASSMPPKTFSQ